MPNFTVAYLPMNTGTFTVDGSQVSLVLLVGLLAISIQIATSSIITNVINEPHEDQLKQLLRQSGMSVQSEVVYRFTIYSILCAILVPLLSLFLKLAILTKVSFLVIFLCRCCGGLGPACSSVALLAWARALYLWLPPTFFFTIAAGYPARSARA